MDLSFNEIVDITAETNIELFSAVNNFIEDMHEHQKKYDHYDYSIIFLGGDKGYYLARLTIIRDGTPENKNTEGDTGSYGVL